MNNNLKNLPKVSVIVLNWNSFDNTVGCLESLLKSKYQNFNIILVDNNSDNKEGRRLKKRFGKSILFVLSKENLGFTDGNNRGIKIAFKDPKTSYVFLLNNDTVVEPNFLEEAVKTALADKRIGMVAPKVFKFHNPERIDTLGIKLTKSGYGKSVISEKEKAICPSGAAGLYSRQMLKQIAINGEYLPSRFFLYYEDLDLGFRGRLAGWKFTLAPKSIVYHKGSATIGVRTDTGVFFSQRNVFWFTLRCFPFFLLLLNLPWIILAHFGAILLYCLRFRKPKIVLKAKLASLKEIPRIFQERKRVQSLIQLPLREILLLVSSELF